MNLAAAAQQDPYTFTALATLLAALGLSSSAGLRAYLPLLAVGLASTATNPIDNTSFIPLQTNFAALSSPPVLIILALLVFAEFAVDKLPIIDHVSDLIHTVIRPVSGAVIMAGTANSLSDHSQALAAVVGGALAFAFHGVKATTRPAVTATTAGIGNMFVSLIEDILVLAAVAALIFLPVIGFVAVVALVVVMFRLVRRTVRRFRGRRAGPPVVVSPAPAAPAKARARGKRAVPALPAPAGGAAMAAGAAAALPVVAAAAPIVPAAPAGPVPTPAANAAPPAPRTAPASPASPDAPTQAATNAPPPYYVPGAAPNPIQPAPGGGNAPTQAYPPAWGQQAPGATPYPPDAPTLPGSYPDTN